jgi:hypothetical protein
MERDLDLIKNILLALEKDEKPFTWKNNLIGIEDSVKYSYHIKLLGEAGLVSVENIGGKGNEWVPYSLTWQGHEFLDAAKNNKAWNKAKDMIGKEGFAVPFSILKELLMITIKSELGLN